MVYRRPRAKGLPGRLTRDDFFADEPLPDVLRDDDFFAEDFFAEDFFADERLPADLDEERLPEDFADDRELFFAADFVAPFRPAADFDPLRLAADFDVVFRPLPLEPDPRPADPLPVDFDDLDELVDFFADDLLPELRPDVPRLALELRLPVPFVPLRELFAPDRLPVALCSALLLPEDPLLLRDDLLPPLDRLLDFPLLDFLLPDEPRAVDLCPDACSSSG